MILYFSKPTPTSLDFKPIAAKDAPDAWNHGRYAQEVTEVKGTDGVTYLVELVPKGKARQQQLFGGDEG